MNNMPETAAVSRMLYEEWFPQIVYNHHQTGPSWARIFLPPFADPVNPNIHPGVTTGVNMVGSAMSNRFAMKKMPGAVSDMIYSMWWNGGMRTVPYFHNMIGILTETSHATARTPSMAGRRPACTKTPPSYKEVTEGWVSLQAPPACCPSVTAHAARLQSADLQDNAA